MKRSEMSNDCRNIRERLRRLSARQNPPEWTADLRAHLDVCPDCRRYAGGLRLAPILWPHEQPLYTTFLREKTLRTVARRAGEQRTHLALLWAPLGLVTLMLPLLLPVLLVGRLLAGWLGQSPAVYGGAFLLVQAASMTVAAVFLAAMVRLRRSGHILLKSTSGV